MKKMTKWAYLFAIASMALLAGCKGDEEPEPEPEPNACETAVYPTATGDASVELLNFSGTSIEVEAGNVLSMAVQVTKGTSRTKKLRLFASDCVNMLGDEFDLSDQPKGGKNGIDLRNTDDAQTRNVNYTIPTGMNPIYLTVQIDEGGGNINYKQYTLNVSGSGLINSYTGVILGANTNANASRMYSGTGITYTACDAAANIDYVDITHAVGTPDGGTTYNSYLCSNPARFLAPIELQNSNPDCGDDTDLSTAGGTATYFAAYAGSVAFADVTSADLEALTVSSSDAQFVVAAVDGVYEFLNNDGHKGLIQVTAENVDATFGLGDGRGSMEVSVKSAR